MEFFVCIHICLKFLQKVLHFFVLASVQLAKTKEAGITSCAFIKHDQELVLIRKLDNSDGLLVVNVFDVVIKALDGKFVAGSFLRFLWFLLFVMGDFFTGDQKD